MNTIFDLNDTEADKDSLDSIGSKAQSLIELRRHGFQVPSGFVITQSAFSDCIEQKAIKEKIDQLIQNSTDAEQYPRILDEIKALIQKTSLPNDLTRDIEKRIDSLPTQKWAVRSSGNLEDLQQQSFAGLYETYLNQTGLDQIVESIKSCWASAFDERVLTYLNNHGMAINQLRMSVVIQEMVDAEISGVAFSVNPMTAQDCEVLLEACEGLGEQLVSGQVTPHQKIYNWRDQQWLSDSGDNIYSGDNVLTDAQALQVCNATIQAQAAYGFPVDIEWAIANGELFLLQCRPITTLHYAAHNKAWTTADFKDGGVSSAVCTPLMWSLYQLVWEDAVPGFLKIVGLLKPQEQQIQWGDMFYGRPYWNLTDIKRLYSLLPGYVERHFDEDLGINPVYEGDGKTTSLTLKSLLQGIELLIRLNRSLNRGFKQWPEIKASFERQLSHYETISESELVQGEIVTFMEKFIRDHYYQNEKNYFLHIFHVTVFSSLFNDSFNKVDADLQMVDLMTGLGNLSHLKLNLAIWDLSRQILQDATQADHWKKRTTEQLVAEYQNDPTQPKGLHQLIQEFKYHSSRELDISVPNFDEDPKWVIHSVKSSLMLDDNQDPYRIHEQTHQQYLHYKQKYVAAVPWWKRKGAEKQLKQIRELLWWREEFRDLSSQYYYWMRRFSLTAGRYLVKQSVLDEVEDVFFLNQNELIDTLQQRLTVAQTRSRIEFHKTYYQSFRNFQNPNEIGNGEPSRSHNQDSENSLQGVGCSPGVVTGTIRVIKDIFDSDRIQDNDILITRFTDPGWTPKFALLKGIATEAGGMLSHAAVISREYGIPAVLAVPGLTDRLQDGQTVRLDGSTGLIEVLEPNHD